MDSSNSKGKKEGLGAHAGYASKYDSNGTNNGSKGIMDSSNSKGKKEGLGAHAGYASKYDFDDNNNGSKGPNATKGNTEKPSLAEAASYHRFGCDTSAIINILAHRDATQRSYIQHEYRAMYSEDLLKCLSSELSGKLENAVLLWMHDPAGRDAVILRQTLVLQKILEAATEVICSRTPSQLQYLKQIYHSKFEIFLEHDIERNTSRDHEKILLAYISSPRLEGPEVNREMADREMAAKDAKALYKAGEKKLGTDEKTFIEIFSQRSAAQLNATSSYYHDMYGHSLKKAVKKEKSGNFGYALLTIARCAQNPAKYFAEVLYKAMKGLGTNDFALIRVIVTRTEIDMQYIKIEYQKKYKKTLNDAVHSETSGHYRAFLLALLGPNQ